MSNPPGDARNQADDEREKTELIDIVGQNLETIVEHQLRVEQGIDLHQRSIETITKSVGRPRFLYGILLAIALWIGVQELLMLLGIKSFDPPPFSWLQGIITLTALVMTTMVLITQNRQEQHTEQRRHLDLQVVLLVEQKVTKVIALLEELRRDIPSVHDRHDPQAEAMQEVLDPHAVLAALDDLLQEGRNEGEDAPES
ncbi:MAG: DUF1003 domain-containing protein [Ktedonobacteraceae bacterium]